MHRPAAIWLLGVVLLAGTAVAAEEWAILGHELGCWSLESPHTPWRRLVVVEFDDGPLPHEDPKAPRKRAVRFVERRHCTEYND